MVSVNAGYNGGAQPRNAKWPPLSSQWYFGNYFDNPVVDGWENKQNNVDHQTHRMYLL